MSSSTRAISNKLEREDKEQTLLEILNFKRYNVHIEGKKREVQQAISGAASRIDVSTVFKFFSDDDNKLCKQLGIYYLCYLQDGGNSEKYFEKFHSKYVDNTEGRADGYLFLSCAKTLNKNYHDPTAVKAVIRFYDRLLKSTDPLEAQEIKLKKAIAHCNKSVLDFRNAAHVGREYNDFSDFNEAYKIQTEILTTSPDCLQAKFDLINTLWEMHATNKIDHANGRGPLAFLQLSLPYLDEFHIATGVEHPLQSSIMDSMAKLKMTEARESGLTKTIEQDQTGSHTVFDTEAASKRPCLRG